MPLFLLDIFRFRKGSFLKEKGFATFFLLAALSIFLLILPVEVKKGFSEIIFSLTYGPFNSISNRIDELYDVYQLKKALDEKATRLALENVQLQEKGRENERLRKMLEFKSSSTYQLLPAEVIFAEPGRFPTSIQINLGEKDGIKKGMPVINLEGLVGRVSEIMSGSSVVQLLFHLNCRVAAMDSRSRIQGIAKSKGGRDLFLENVPLEEDVKPGDVIYTSGMGGVYPPGLKIGQVTRVSQGNDNIFKTITLRPAVGFSRLEELFVIKI